MKKFINLAKNNIAKIKIFLYNRTMEKLKLTVKDSCLSFFTGFLFMYLGTIVFSLILNITFQIGNLGDFEKFAKSCVGYLVSSIVMYAIVFAVAFKFNKNKDNKIISKPKIYKLLIYILIAVISFFALLPIVNYLNNLFAHIGFKSNPPTYEFTLPNYLISIISFAVLPAVCEEFLFRGVIFKGLQNKGKVFACTISSLMFAIYHMSIYQSIYPILFGLILAMVMHKENNLVYCSSMHFVNNLLTLTITYFNLNLFSNHWSYILLAIILFAVVTTLVIITLLKNRHSTNKQKFTSEERNYLIIILTIMLILWILSNIII